MHFIDLSHVAFSAFTAILFRFGLILFCFRQFSHLSCIYTYNAFHMAIYWSPFRTWQILESLSTREPISRAPFPTGVCSDLIEFQYISDRQSAPQGSEDLTFLERAGDDGDNSTWRYRSLSLSVRSCNGFHWGSDPWKAIQKTPVLSGPFLTNCFCLCFPREDTVSRC